ncbi:4895_t:CDS:2 [Entrophospora sp. SA101]|nr:4895_t:CDS:2 [Entrophospora sp. SA101]
MADNTSTSSLSSRSNVSLGGRPPAEVWKHFIKGDEIGPGKYTAACSYCNEFFSLGMPYKMKSHLSNHCPTCPRETSAMFPTKKITSSSVKSILREHNFYHNLETLILILKPIKEAINVLEADTTNLADCFFNLVKLAVAIKKIPKNHSKNFFKHCVGCFNKRWAEFEYSGYLLTFFLHPYYRESEQVFNCSNENNNRKRVGDIKNRQNNKTKKSKRSKIINICESDDEYQDGLMESERIDNRICKKGTKEKNSSKDMEDDEKDNSEEENSEEENNEEENSEKDNSEEENMEDEDKESEDDNEKSDDESEKSDDKINKSAATKKFKLRNRQDISYKV